MTDLYNRREFIKRSSKLASGMALAASLPSISCAGNNPLPKIPVSLVQSEQLAAGKGLKQSVLINMLDQGVMHVTGYTNPTKAWQSLFNKNDKVALKVNCIGRETGSSKPELCYALAECLNTHVSIPPEQIIIFDRTDIELQKAGYRINRSDKGIKAYASPGFTGKFKAGPFTTGVSTIIADECTALINIPLLKTHRGALLTMNLKNNYGSIPQEIVRDSKLKFHSNGKFENIVHVNSLSPIKDKTRLCIADGLVAQYDKGPKGDPGSQWPFGGIIMGADPVAVDTAGLNIINAKRLENSLNPYTVKYLQWAEQEGLGMHNPKALNIIHKMI